MLNSVARSVVESVRGEHPGYVFSYHGYRLHHINNTGWKQARARAGLLQVRVHDLKHNAQFGNMRSISHDLHQEELEAALLGAS